MGQQVGCHRQVRVAVGQARGAELLSSLLAQAGLMQQTPGAVVTATDAAACQPGQSARPAISPAAFGVAFPQQRQPIRIGPGAFAQPSPRPRLRAAPGHAKGRAQLMDRRVGAQGL